MTSNSINEYDFLFGKVKPQDNFTEVVNSSNVKYPEVFYKNKDIADKYNLWENYKKFSKVKPPKRGYQKEAMSDARNSFRRAQLDKKYSSDESLRESFRVGTALFDGHCYISGVKLYNDDGTKVDDVSIQADHVVSSIHGGVGSAGNMLPALTQANNGKGDLKIDDLDIPDSDKEKIEDFQKLYGYAPLNEYHMNNSLKKIDSSFDFANDLNIGDLTEREIRKLNKHHNENSKALKEYIKGLPD